MRRRWFLPALTMVLSSAAGGFALAQGDTDESVLERLWRSPGESAPLFSDMFLNDIPMPQIEAIMADLLKTCGAFETVQRLKQAGAFTLIAERCEIPTNLERDGEDKIIGLFFQTPVRRDASLSDLLDEIRSFDGDVSYAVVENGDMIAGHDAERPMAVGSAFKIIVFAALLDVIDRGQAAWSDVVTLEEKHVSLPSGLLQDMPIGSPFTLHTLAAAMISQSDNTATDVLIDVLGRGRLEASSGLLPFLTTRELFQLKADDDTYGRYEKADLAGRQAILDALAEAPLPPDGLTYGLWRPEAEWFLSTETLCAWMETVADQDLMQINAGILRSTDWDRVAFKGGSEPGVLNYTTLARDEQDRDFCVSVTWNTDRAIDGDPLTGLYAAIFHRLKKRP